MTMVRFTTVGGAGAGVCYPMAAGDNLVTSTLTTQRNDSVGVIKVDARIAKRHGADLRQVNNLTSWPHGAY